MKTLPFRAFFWMWFAAGFPIICISCRAEANCPGSIPGLHPRLVAGALVVVPVKINGAGPFELMVDTGSQINVVDPALAKELDLKPKGKVGLVATETVYSASVVVLDSLETGSFTVTEPLAAVQDLGPIQAADPRIRGVLGENFLAHFNVLIDYPHRLLCLDRASEMQNDLRGDQIPLAAPKDSETDLPFTQRLVISVNLSDTGTRPILLQVDSGSDGPILYAGKKELEEPLLKRAKLQVPNSGGARRAFDPLPPQDMKLGSRVVRNVPFVTPASAAQNAPDREEDGILATILFRRVYISHSDRFIIFDPR